MRVKFDPADFSQWALAADIATDSGTPQRTKVLRTDDLVPTAMIDALVGLDAKFAASWNRERPDFASQSEYDLSLARLAALAGWDDQDIVSMVLEHRRRAGGDHYADVASRPDYFDRLLAKARKPPGTNDSSQPARPRIIVHPGQQHEAVRAAEDILLAQPTPLLFQRDRLLVRPVKLPEPSNCGGVVRPAGAYVLQVVDTAYLVNLLTSLIDWRRIKSGRPVPIDAPRHVVDALLASCGDWKIPPLLGIVEAPTLRPDGSLLLANGYDGASGLLLDYVGPEIPPLKDSPTRDDALAALATLEEVFSKFPFVAECDRSVLIAAIITGLVRRTLRSAPMFLFRAPSRGSGKSLLTDCTSIIVVGRDCGAMTAGQDSTEERKQIFAILLEGDLVACIDNVERTLSSSDLCVVLTQQHYRGRVLGVSKTVKVPTNVLWLATGNNLQVDGDLVSRVLTCDLDPKCEAPESREFEGDLRAEVLNQRGLLIHAALTVLRAYQAAGSPRMKMPAFGRFEQWSNVVRAPLVWLGREDPLKSAARLRSEDPSTNRLRALLHSWRGHTRQPTTIARLTLAATKAHEGELYDALFEIAGTTGGGLDSKAIGSFVRMNVGRIVDGMSLQREGTTHGAARWSVRVHGGDRGDLPNPHRENSEDDEDAPRARTRVGPEPVPPVPPAGNLRPPEAPAVVPDGSASARAPCYHCGSTRRWHRRGGRAWTCGTCHPPSVAAADVEWSEPERLQHGGGAHA